MTRQYRNMKLRIAEETACALLILLFVYTGVSKLLDFTAYQASLAIQPLPGWAIRAGSVLPLVEIITGLGVVFNKSRRLSLYVYALLMFCFTVYTALVEFHFFKEMPCTCGGVLEHISWGEHLVLNVFFLTLTVTVIRINYLNKIIMHNEGVS